VNSQTNKRLIGLSVTGLVIAALYVLPFYILFTNAFKTKRNILVDTLGLPETITFGNFGVAMEKMAYFRSFSNSLIVTVGSILIIVLFSSMAAWVLVRTKSKASNFVFFLLVSAMLIPFQSIMLPLVRLMGMMNLLNSHIGIMIMYLGFGASMAVFLYHGFIKAVPLELEEAAMIDGAHKVRTYWQIVFPLLKPITASVIVLNMIWIWNDYLLPSLVLQRREVRTIPLQIAYFFGTFSADWELAMAALTLSIIPVIIFYLFMQRFIIGGLMAGSIK